MHRVFKTVADTYQAHLNDIKNAQNIICLENYILEDLQTGEIGRTYLEALVERATAGVKVELLLDFQGSFILYSDQKLNNWLQDSGVKITYYKTSRLPHSFNPRKFILRDHRKLLLIDHKITWIGGVVIGESYRDWNDLMVRFTDLEIADYSNREFRRQLERIHNNQSLLAPLDRMNDHTKLVGNSPGIGNRFGYETISHQLMAGRKSATLISPYFSPPLRLRRIIEHKLREGLEITLIIPRHTDQTTADWARETYLKYFVKQGLVVGYLDNINHAKMVIIDDYWASFGSMNLDPLSLIANHELNVATTDPILVRDLKTIAKSWQDQATIVSDPQDVMYYQMSRGQQLLGHIMRYFV